MTYTHNTSNTSPKISFYWILATFILLLSTSFSGISAQEKGEMEISYPEPYDDKQEAEEAYNALFAHEKGIEKELENSHNKDKSLPPSVLGEGSVASQKYLLQHKLRAVKEHRKRIIRETIHKAEEIRKLESKHMLKVLKKQKEKIQKENKLLANGIDLKVSAENFQYISPSSPTSQLLKEGLIPNIEYETIDISYESEDENQNSYWSEYIPAFKFPNNKQKFHQLIANKTIHNEYSNTIAFSLLFPIIQEDFYSHPLYSKSFAPFSINIGLDYDSFHGG